jgi:leader peptidase (prepilin peptidase) / N-methyltransferase
MSWPWVLGAVLIGLALGPALDGLAGLSVGRADWKPRPLATAVIAAMAGGCVVILVPDPALAPAWWILALVGTIIVRTDLATHRIPNAVTAPAFGCAAVLLAIPWDMTAYARAWLAALSLTVVFLVMATLVPTGLGMGDVKLAPTLGLYLGYLGWSELLVGVMAGFVVAAAVSLIIVLRHAVARRSVGAALRRAVPFGPFLLLGALVGLAVS